jgi:uncharacterized protein
MDEHSESDSSEEIDVPFLDEVDFDDDAESPHDLVFPEIPPVLDTGFENPSLIKAMAEEKTILPIPPKPVVPEPVTEKERFATMDVMRGLAVFGILFINIEDFALVTSARYAWWVSGGRGELNQMIWEYTFFFFDTQFIAIFTMLFGAGIAVFEEKRERSGKRYLVSYFNRMLILLVVGGVHTILLWDGDILFDYAFWGIILFFAPRLPVWMLLIWSMLMIWMNSASISFGFSMSDPVNNYELTELYRGGWLEQVEYRWSEREIHFFKMPLQFVFQAVGHMTMGMALYKSRILAGKWPAWNYLILIPVFGWFGYTLIHDGADLATGLSSPSEYRNFYWGSFLLTFSYLSAMAFAGKTLMWFWPVKALSCAGRMALSNYLFQSVVCTTVFYGWGFGQYEHWDRTWLLALILAIIGFELVFSWLWFRKFQFGPAEWLWRTATYGKLQPMVKEETKRPKYWGDLMPEDEPTTQPQ